MKGYTGKILHVDLTNETFQVEEPDEAFYRTYIGGAAMGAYYLLKEMAPGIDPYAHENVVVISISCVVGAPISGSPRHCVTSKSPLTGGIASSEGGGYWGPELKNAGFDAIVIKGKSRKPVYLWIKNGEFGLRSAEELWGKLTGDVQEIIRKEMGDRKVRVLQIGPAGEKLVRFAGIVNELKHFNGRAGLGAVMGSKNLRAVAVRGSYPPEYADINRIKELAKEGVNRVNEDGFWNMFRTYGTLLNMTWNTDFGGLPTKNWTRGTFDQIEKVSAETYEETMMDKPGTCWACAQSCKRDVKSGIKSPWPIDARYGGPEYETAGMCGPNCMVSDLNAIVKTNEIASKYCMDTISLGGTIGFVMDCYENGILTQDQLGGVDARFGNGEALVQLAEMIAKREGFGDKMAEGTARLAEELGPEARRLAVYVKGKEFPAHMPRAKSIMGLIYAANPFGPDHVSSEHDQAISINPGEILRGLGIYDTAPDVWRLSFEKVKLLVYSQRFISALDSFSVCQFCFNTWAIFSFEELIDVIQSVTGWNYTLHEFMLLGERRINMMRIFNEREGFDSKDDILPARLLKDPLEDDGPRKGAVYDEELFHRYMKDYYFLNGWDTKTGNPLEAKLKELGLGWVRK